MLDKIITYSFYLLFFLTPLFWTSFNYELFEYNKMILVYVFTVIIMGAWLFKSINDKRLPINGLLIDDVWTTGSTLRECCYVLKRAGAKKVWAITLAR